MKIDDKYKDIQKVYDPDEPIDPEYLESLLEDEDLLRYQEMENDRIEAICQHNKKAALNWEEQGEANLHSLRRKQLEAAENPPLGQQPNFIGERILFIRQLNGQTASDLYENIGISRSSLYRFETGITTPSEKMLRKLIDGLLVTVADFCYEPDDFELWKSCFVPSDNGVNIFSYRANILQEMQKNVYYYKMGDKLVRLPNSYFMKLRKLLVSSFEILDLLNHDKEQ